MSQSTAIASTTAALFHLLSNAGITVTTLAPNSVSAGSSDRINLFLYGTEVNPAFRNDPMPGALPPGQPGPPPLALVLRYLITAYGDNSDFSVHENIGKAMLVLHDNAILSKAQISGLIPDAGLPEQYEKIKITPLPLSLDDMSKLWTSFQTDYRLSAAYEVSVVLIESSKAIKSPLPVIKRGEQDRGPSIVPSPGPSISGFRYPNLKPAANFGDIITILGEHLAGAGIKVRFQHPKLTEAIELTAEDASTEHELKVKIDAVADDAEVGSKWPAGFYQVSLQVDLPDTPAWTSNTLSMALAPEILSVSPQTAPAGAVPLTIESLPQIKQNQDVALVFSDQLIEVTAIAVPVDLTTPANLQFTIANAVARPEPYLLRLRIDGVDSIPVDFSGDTPAFDDSQKVAIT